MHRIKIEQIADHDLRTHVAQCMRAFVFISHHRTHGFALLQQHFGDRTPYRATRPAAPVTRMGFATFLMRFTPHAKGSSLDKTVERNFAAVG